MFSRQELAAALCLALGSSIAFAQGATSRTLVRTGHLLDVKTGRLLDAQTIVVTGDTISSVAATSSVTAQPGDKVIDLGGLTVMPGLIDVHTHITGVPNFDLRDAINQGEVPGPHMQVSGPALGITGGHCDENLLPIKYHVIGEGVADGIAAVQQKVRQNIKYGVDVIKICATGGVLSKGDDTQASQYTLEEMRAIVADAHRLGRKVAAHAHGAQGILWATQAGVDSIEHGSYIDDAGIAEMKKN